MLGVRLDKNTKEGGELITLEDVRKNLGLDDQVYKKSEKELTKLDKQAQIKIMNFLLKLEALGCL